MHSFEVHSNESACRKSGRLGLEQVIYLSIRVAQIFTIAQAVSYHSGARAHVQGRHRHINKVDRKKLKSTFKNADLFKTTRYFSEKKKENLVPEEHKLLVQCTKIEIWKKESDQKKHNNWGPSAVTFADSNYDNTEEYTHNIRDIVESVINGFIFASREDT